MRDAGWALVLMVLLSAVALTGGLAIFIDEPSHATGLVHPEIDSLKIGGDAAARHGPVLMTGWLCSTLIFALIIVLMAFGYRDRARLKVVGPWFAGAFVVEAALLAMVMLTYRQSLTEPVEIVMAFPVPTAWLVYGLWTSKLMFLVIFVVTFRRAYWRPEDEQGFAALIASLPDPEPDD